MKSKFLSDFKAFAMRGNVIDMAVGVIIGGAFGKIVSSLVGDIITPAIGLLVGGIDLKGLKLVITPECVDSGGVVVPEVSLGYGNFLQNTIDFIIIAFSIFVFINIVGKIMRKKEEVAPVPAAPTPTNEEKLLAEIRDLLKKK
ncbi:MAG: large-conductance mechanosensitive channel protein MscL [Muribaculaceae bacterium]|nr:large-conductance mechanosensitive channel protein MscL [Muribaculaceae bacterium]